MIVTLCVIGAVHCSVLVYKHISKRGTVWRCMLEISEESDIFRIFNDSVVIFKLLDLWVLFEVAVPLFS